MGKWCLYMVIANHLNEESDGLQEDLEAPDFVKSNPYVHRSCNLKC